MTTDTEATPVKTMLERVWTIIKDSGPMHSSAVASRMGISLRQARQTISNLVSRNMVERVGIRAFGGETKYRALGDTYEDARTFERTPVKTTSITPPHQRSTSATANHTGLAALPREVEGLTIAELRDLHRALSELFS